MIEILLAPGNMFMLGMAAAFFMSAWLSAPVTTKRKDVTECARE